VARWRSAWPGHAAAGGCEHEAGGVVAWGLGGFMHEDNWVCAASKCLGGSLKVKQGARA